MFRIILIALVLSANIFAAEIPDYLKNEYEFKEFRPEFSEKFSCEKHHHNLFQSYLDESYINIRPYDVLSYDLFLDWSGIFDTVLTNRTYTGINKIKILITDLTGNITFDAKKLQIDSIFQGSSKISEDKIFRFSDSVTISDKSLQVDDEIEYTIYFTYNNPENGGFYLYKDQPNMVAYTQSEPQDARYWFPCNDQPNDKAISSISVRVPEDFTAVSNGTLDTIITDEKTKTFYYSHPSPITTYLMVANASEYVTFRDWYHRVENPNDSIPIDYFVWNEDLGDGEFKNGENDAKYAYRNVPKMIEIMSEYYGEYPYEKYGMTAVEPYMFGGMEHQTMTTVHRNWLQGYSGLGILHEIAHQWLGDLITCATWSDLWINEGGATFSECIFYETWTEDPNYYFYLTSNNIYRVKNDETCRNFSLHGLPVENVFSSGYTLQYYKGSLVYHMLKYWLGDEAFFSTLRNFLDTYKFTSVETKDFANFFIENNPNSELDLEQYFEQWVFGKGYPVYNISGHYEKNDDEAYDITLNIDQIQENYGMYPLYEMPLEFLMIKDSVVVDTIKVYNNTKEQTYNISLDYIPDEITVDDFSVLNRSNYYPIQDLTDIKYNNNIESYIYPNPVISSGAFYVHTDNILRSVKLIDELGNEILKTDNSHVNFNQEIQNGMYFVIIETNKGLETHKIMIIR